MKRLALGFLAAAASVTACGDIDVDNSASGPEVLGSWQPALQSAWPWPLAGTVNRDWVINNYVDLDSAGGLLRDYQNGQRTYDGHAGIDIDVPTFRSTDAGVQVRAVTAGQVIALDEGQPDRNLVCNGAWNFVTVRSSDGYQTTYGHLKRDSVLVTVGQNVVAGTPLAVVGSSGCSSQAHLHLETANPSGQIVEPFQTMFWASPPPYNSTWGLMDHVTSDIFQARKDFMDPRPNVATFAQGSPLSIAVHTGGGAAGNNVTVRVRRPNASVFNEATYPLDRPIGHGQWLWNWFLEANAQLGTWTFDVLINGAVARTSTFNVVAGRSFFDDFSDGNSSGWTTSGGSWSVTQGEPLTGDSQYRALSQNNTSGAARARATSVTAFNDQVARARLRIEATSGTTWSASLLGRVVDNSNFYQLALVSTNGTGTVQVIRVSGGTSTVLATVPLGVATGTLYDLRLEAVGSTLRAFVNDAQVATASDATHASGTVGVATSAARAHFGLIKISTPTAVTGTPPGPATDPSPATSATVTPPVGLSFTAGATATSHDVYFGAANPPPFVANQTGTSFNPGTLQASTTYFWRIDERNVAGVTTGTVWQFTTIGGTTTLFTDDFESGTTSKWTLLSGSWSIVTDGTRAMRQATLTDNARAQTNSAAWTNQRVSARVKATSFNGSDRFVAVLARVQNASNYYYATLRSSGKLELKKLVNGGSTTLATKSFSISANTWYTVRLEVVGTNLTLYVNGTQHLTGSDSQFASGRAGLATFFASAVFDDVTVNP